MEKLNGQEPYFSRMRGVISTMAGILIALLFLLLMIFRDSGYPLFGILDSFELKLYDQKFLLRGEREPDPRIVIGAIDDRALEKYGRWPFERKVFADIVDALSFFGASLIIFDVSFSEPSQEERFIERLKDEIKSIPSESIWGRESEVEDKGGIPVQARLLDILSSLSTNRVLEQSISRSGAVILGYIFNLDGETCKDGVSPLPGEIPTIPYSGEVIANITSACSAITNITPLSRSARSQGFYNIFPDSDGTIRRALPFVSLGSSIYPSLSLTAFREIHREKFGFDFTLRGKEGGLLLETGKGTIPLSRDGTFLINFRGGRKTYPHISVSELIEAWKGKDDSFGKRVKEKLVFIGATALGISDLRDTPFENAIPGVDIHAHILDDLLHGDVMMRGGKEKIFEILAIIAIGIFIPLLITRLSLTGGALICGLFLISLPFLDFHFFFNKGSFVKVGLLMAQTLFTYLIVVIYNYSIEYRKRLRIERERRRITDLFKSYVSPEVVDEMINEPDRVKLGGEKRDVTLLFSDIRGFTTISEMLPPSKLTLLLNEYFEEMTEVIFKYGGTLDKYIGDAIMAIFGAPLKMEGHELKSCLSGLRMLEALKGLRERWRVEGKPLLYCGIGINSGIVSVGNMGSSRRFDYTAIGDEVNLASRLEGLTRFYGVEIIAGENTRSQVSDGIIFRELDWVRVKGKERPVGIFEVVGEAKGSETPEFVGLFEEGLRLYRARSFSEARKRFKEVIKAKGRDRPSEIFVERIDFFIKNPPPPDWKGDFTFSTK